MAKGVNKVILLGNLGRDPEMRESKSGLAITKINLAINERKKEGGEWVDHVEWVRVTCFGKLAENTHKFLEKGRQIYAEGKMRTSSYTDKNGNEKWTTEVTADEIVFIGGNGGGRDKPLSSTKDDLDF